MRSDRNVRFWNHRFIFKAYTFPHIASLPWKLCHWSRCSYIKQAQERSGTLYQSNLVLQHLPFWEESSEHLCSEGLAIFSTLLPFTEAKTSTACTAPNLLAASPVTPEGYFTSVDANSFYHMIQLTKELWSMSQLTKKKKIENEANFSPIHFKIRTAFRGLTQFEAHLMTETISGRLCSQSCRGS